MDDALLFLDGYAVKLAPETGAIQGGVFGFVEWTCTLRAKRNYVRFTHSVTAFHLFPPTARISLAPLAG